jgi:hypothetical protein
MRLSIAIFLGAAVCGIAGPAELSRAQSAPGSVALRPTDQAGDHVEPKFTFILFSKDSSASTQRVAAELASALEQTSQRAEWKSVSITDPANRDMVERYQVGRAPMPLVLCVAPNGAVTGAMVGKVNKKAVEAALVTPTMTRCMKSLQAGKIVVVHVQSDATLPLPSGATEFLADPAFQQRAATESFLVNDPAEARFLSDMELDPATVSGSSVVVLAPPGTLVGKFPATATAAEIAAKLHAAGKCCNDPNCKHNQKAQ